MAEPELVLELGVEGGGATVYRTANASGGWLYHFEGNSMYLDENDDEGWRTWTTEPVDSVQAAIQSIDENGTWVLFYPMIVHPEYRAIIWELVQETASKLPARHAELWQSRSRVWQRRCGPQS